MSRPLQRTFNCEALADLTRQLQFAPHARRIRQIREAEQLHDEIDAQLNYPLEFVIYRITGYRRPDAQISTLLVGQALKNDLCLLIDALSRSCPVPPRENEGVESASQIATRLQVSTRTVDRWRHKGLRWRWQPNPEAPSRPHLVFTEQAVDHFLHTHAEEVARAAHFSHIAPELRQRIIDRARRIASARDVTLNQVAQHLARRVGRGLQTIRNLLEQHERQHPDQPIFVDRTGPLNSWQKRVIWRAFRAGTPVGRLAVLFGRTRSTIYRAINDRRATLYRRMRIHYTQSVIFTRPDADDVILRQNLPEPEFAAVEHESAAARRAAEALPPELKARCDARALSEQRLHSLLVRMNYLRYRAHSTIGQLNRYEPRATDLAAIEADLKHAAQIREQLIKGSLPLLLPIARRHLADTRSPQQLTTLLEAGQQVLTHAIDHYDITRPQSFPAYLTWLLMRHFATESRSQTVGR